MLFCLVIIVLLVSLPFLIFVFCLLDLCLFMIARCLDCCYCSFVCFCCVCFDCVLGWFGCDGWCYFKLCLFIMLMMCLVAAYDWVVDIGLSKLCLKCLFVIVLLVGFDVMVCVNVICYYLLIAEFAVRVLFGLGWLGVGYAICVFDHLV